MSTKTMSHLSFPEMLRVLPSTRRSHFVCQCYKHWFRILKTRTFIRTSTDRRRARCWSEKKRNRGEIPGDASPQRPQRPTETKAGLLPFKPQNNYPCMKLPCGCDVSAEEQVVCQPASQERHDWRTRGARLTPLVWLTHGAPVPSHLAEL